MFTRLRCDLTLTPHSRISLFPRVLSGFDPCMSPWDAPGYPGDPGDLSSGKPADIYNPAHSYRVELTAASLHLINLLFRILFDLPAFHNVDLTKANIISVHLIILLNHPQNKGNDLYLVMNEAILVGLMVQIW